MAIRTVPAGAVVWGIQLPVQSQSNLYVSAWEKTASVEDMAAIAAGVEQAGGFYLGVCDHTAIPDRLVGGMGAVWYDTIATLGWLAGITRRIRLLSHVLTLSQRHPLRAAKELATIDRLSGGRLIAGVGVGHVREEFDVLVGPAAFAERGVDADEALRALKASLCSPAPVHEGRRWQFSGMHLGPAPVQRPRPPLWIGGSSTHALRRVALHGDGWLPQGTPRAEMPGKISQLERFCAECGRAMVPDIGMIVEPLHLVPAARPGPGWELPPGTLVGTAEQVAGSLRELVAMGVNHLQVRFRARSAGEYVEQAQWFGAEVMPMVA